MFIEGCLLHVHGLGQCIHVNIMPHSCLLHYVYAQWRDMQMFAKCRP